MPRIKRLANLYLQADLAMGMSDPCIVVSDCAAFPAALEILAAGGKQLAGSQGEYFM